MGLCTRASNPRQFDSTKLALLYRETIPSDYDGEHFVVAVKHSGATGPDTGCYIVIKGCVVFTKCFVACIPFEESQHPT